MRENIKFEIVKKLLESLSFTEEAEESHIIFRHGSGRPIIILPRLRRDEIVSPTHLLMVKKQLLDVGLVEADEFNWRMQRA